EEQPVVVKLPAYLLIMAHRGLPENCGSRAPPSQSPVERAASRISAAPVAVTTVSAPAGVQIAPNHPKPTINMMYAIQPAIRVGVPSSPSRRLTHSSAAEAIPIAPPNSSGPVSRHGVKASPSATGIQLWKTIAPVILASARLSLLWRIQTTALYFSGSSVASGLRISESTPGLTFACSERKMIC